MPHDYSCPQEKENRAVCDKQTFKIRRHRAICRLDDFTNDRRNAVRHFGQRQKPIAPKTLPLPPHAAPQPRETEGEFRIFVNVFSDILIDARVEEAAAVKDKPLLSNDAVFARMRGECVVAYAKGVAVALTDSNRTSAFIALVLLPSGNHPSIVDPTRIAILDHAHNRVYLPIWRLRIPKAVCDGRHDQHEVDENRDHNQKPKKRLDQVTHCLNPSPALSDISSEHSTSAAVMW
jgi:hypothetical protein